jgi:hypothetical protein
MNSAASSFAFKFYLRTLIFQLTPCSAFANLINSASLLPVVCTGIALLIHSDGILVKKESIHFDCLVTRIGSPTETLRSAPCATLPPKFLKYRLFKISAPPHSRVHPESIYPKYFLYLFNFWGPLTLVRGNRSRINPHRMCKRCATAVYRRLKPRRFRFTSIRTMGSKKGRDRAHPMCNDRRKSPIDRGLR